MIARLISANSSELLKMNGDELKQSIKASEGRTVLSENVVIQPAIDGLTMSEIAAAFGADLILLNLFDVFEPKVSGLEVKDAKDTVKRLKELTGRPIGVNLEPVDPDVKMESAKFELPKGRIATAESMRRAEELGFNFVCYPGAAALPTRWLCKLSELLKRISPAWLLQVKCMVLVLMSQ